MDKIITQAKISARGGLHLFLGVSLSSVISAVGTIILARLLTPSQYGLFTVAFMPPTLIGLFRDWGINFSVIRYLAQYKSNNNITAAKRVLISGLLCESVLGILLSVACFSLSSFLALNVFNRPEVQPLIGITSITILAGALFTFAQSTFTGFEKMELSSLTMIIQSGFKSFLAPILVLLGYGTLGAVLGYTTAFVISSLLGILTIYVLFHKNLRQEGDYSNNLASTFKTMLKYGLPLYISTLLGGLLAQFYNFMIAIYCTDFLIGNYQVAINFSVLINFFTTPITTVLFPVFSKLDPEKEMKTLRTIFQSSIKYACLVTIPATAAIMVLSTPLTLTLFGEKYTYAPFFVTLYAISYLYAALGNLSLGNFLNGQGKTIVTMKLSLITLATGIPLGFLLIPMFQIIGLIIAILISGFPSLVAGLWWVKEHYDVTVDFGSSTKIIVASATAAIVTLLILSQIPTLDWKSLVIGGTIFLVTYLVTLPLTRAVTADDIKNLRHMLNELGPFSYLFNLLLNLIEKLTTIFKT